MAIEAIRKRKWPKKPSNLESWSWKQWNRRGLNKHEEWTDANKVSVLQMLRNEIMYIMFCISI